MVGIMLLAIMELRVKLQVFYYIKLLIIDHFSFSGYLSIFRLGLVVKILFKLAN